MNTPMTQPTLLHLEVFAKRCILHPDLVRRFVSLGLLEPAKRTSTDLWFTDRQVHRVARMQRLRSDLALNYAALGLVLDLLDRIEQLETAPYGRPNPAPER